MDNRQASQTHTHGGERLLWWLKHQVWGYHWGYPWFWSTHHRCWLLHLLLNCHGVFVFVVWSCSTCRSLQIQCAVTMNTLFGFPSYVLLPLKSMSRLVWAVVSPQSVTVITSNSEGHNSPHLHTDEMWYNRFSPTVYNHLLLLLCSAVHSTKLTYR